MTATRPTRRRSLAAAGGAATVIVLAGCGAGQVGNIGYQVAAINGATVSVGDLSILDLTMLYPNDGKVLENTAAAYEPGDDVPLLFTITNTSITADRLVSISTPAARSVEITGSTAVPASASISTFHAVQLYETPSLTVPATPSVTPAPAVEGAPGVELNGSISAELTDLTQTILPGPTIDVTFTFERAGQVTAPVPLASPNEARPAGGEG